MNMLDQLRQQRTHIQALGRQFGARRIRVFGSVASGKENPQSDIDFLVDFPRGYDLFKQRMALAEALEQLVQKPVDLLPEHEINPNIKEQVLREAVEI